MFKRTITPEQKEQGDFPMCRRCTQYENARSSVYGDAWGCAKGHCSIDVDDNDWDMEHNNNFEINDCGDYDFGEPKVYNLG